MYDVSHQRIVNGTENHRQKGNPWRFLGRAEMAWELYFCVWSVAFEDWRDVLGAGRDGNGRFVVCDLGVVRGYLNVEGGG